MIEIIGSIMLLIFVTLSLPGSRRKRYHKRPEGIIKPSPPPAPPAPPKKKYNTVIIMVQEVKHD